MHKIKRRGFVYKIIYVYFYNILINRYVLYTAGAGANRNNVSFKLTQYTPCLRKKEPLFYCPYLCQMLTDFQNVL